MYVIPLNMFDFFCRKYASLPEQAQIGNVLGVVLVILAGIVVFVVTNSAFKRVNTDEEHVSLINDDKE